MYIVIEKHGGAEYAAIVTNEEGQNLVFDTKEEAQAEADDCQDGIVVQLYDLNATVGPVRIDWSESQAAHLERHSGDYND